MNRLPDDDRRPPLKGWELVWMVAGCATFAGMVLMVIYAEQIRAAVWGAA